jgi:hypothetical protein
MARSTATLSEKVIENDDVDFNARATAAAWEACDELPAVVAATLVNEFTDYGPVGYWEGVESDRDVTFGEYDVGGPGIPVEEKAVGVCPRDVAEQYAPMYVELERDDDHVLAINPGQIFKN